MPLEVLRVVSISFDEGSSTSSSSSKRVQRFHVWYQKMERPQGASEESRQGSEGDRPSYTWKVENALRSSESVCRESAEGEAPFYYMVERAYLEAWKDEFIRDLGIRATYSYPKLIQRESTAFHLYFLFSFYAWRCANSYHALAPNSSSTFDSLPTPMIKVASVIADFEKLGSHRLESLAGSGLARKIQAKTLHLKETICIAKLAAKKKKVDELLVEKDAGCPCLRYELLYMCYFSNLLKEIEIRLYPFLVTIWLEEAVGLWVFDRGCELNVIIECYNGREVEVTHDSPPVKPLNPFDRDCHD
ncbi:hypothetical protein CR513_31902, partial [Mucuna pruriens]